jgi:hypothetical protein
MPPVTREKFKREICEALDSHCAGDIYDEAGWARILELED